MKKPKPVKVGKGAKPWAPVPVPVQRRQHWIAVRNWKPIPVSVQRKRHKAAVKAAGKPVKSKVRKLALGEGVACCSAQAVGTLLGLTDDEVLALYRLTADGPDEGASIEATLEAANNFINPHISAPETYFSDTYLLGLALPEGPHAVLATPDGWWSWGELYDPGQFPGAVIEEAWAVTW